MVVVVGGHSRNIGKTSVICGIIRALKTWNWTAIKITPHAHNVPQPSTDTDRFLSAGAARAFLAQSDTFPPIEQLLAESRNAIIESNSILRFLEPDICAMVVDGAVPDFKPSALEFIGHADFLVVTSDASLGWPQVPPILLSKTPRFSAPPPDYENAELVAAISSFVTATVKSHELRQSQNRWSCG